MIEGWQTPPHLISKPLLEDTVRDTIVSFRLIDELCQDGLVPDARKVVEGIAAELERRLVKAIHDARLSMHVRRHLPYDAFWQAARGEWLAIEPPDELRGATAAVVTFDRRTGGPLHVFEVAARWDESTYLTALGRLARLLYLCYGAGGGRGTLLFTGLIGFHVHSEDEENPPWQEPHGKKSLERRIEGAIETRFGRFSGNLDTIVCADTETVYFDYWSTLEGGGDGTVTASFIRFAAFPELFAPPARDGGA